MTTDIAEPTDLTLGEATQLQQAAAALTAVCNGEPGTWQDVPVPIRAALAAIALTVADQRVNGVALAKAGGYSRGTAARTDSPWKVLLAALSTGAPDLVAALDLPVFPSPLGTRAAVEIAKRDKTIAELRAEITDLKCRVGPLTDYAHDLAVELRLHREHERAALDATVRHLAPVD
ncbi:MAG: hypothetical protein ACR2HR_04415 [Euzebya sp.]